MTGSWFYLMLTDLGSNTVLLPYILQEPQPPCDPGSIANDIQPTYYTMFILGYWILPWTTVSEAVVKVSLEFHLEATGQKPLWTLEGHWALFLDGVSGQLAVPCLVFIQSAHLSSSHNGRATVLAMDEAVRHANGKIPAPCWGEGQEDGGGQRHREVSLMKMRTQQAAFPQDWDKGYLICMVIVQSRAKFWRLLGARVSKASEPPGAKPTLPPHLLLYCGTLVLHSVVLSPGPKGLCL